MPKYFNKKASDGKKAVGNEGTGKFITGYKDPEAHTKQARDAARFMRASRPNTSGGPVPPQPPRPPRVMPMKPSAPLGPAKQKDR